MSSFDRRTIVGAILVLGAAACVAPSATVSSKSSLRSSTRLVTQQELEPLGVLALDEALLRVRPELLRYHGQSVRVYVEGRPATSLDLHALNAEGVARVRLLSPVEAAVEYGSLSGFGPILDVRLRAPH